MINLDPVDVAYFEAIDSLTNGIWAGMSLVDGSVPGTSFIESWWYLQYPLTEYPLSVINCDSDTPETTDD